MQVSNIPRYSYLIDQQDTDNTNLNLFNGPEFTISASGGGKEYNGKQYHPFPTAIIAENRSIRMEQTTRQKPPTQIMPLIYLSTQPTGAYPLRTRYCFVKEMLISGSFVIPITMCMLQLSK